MNWPSYIQSRPSCDVSAIYDAVGSHMTDPDIPLQQSTYAHTSIMVMWGSNGFFSQLQQDMREEPKLMQLISW
jgi:hypothetical protein